MQQVLKSYLEHICGRENVLQDEPMSNHTTFKIGGKAKFFVTAKSKQALINLTSALRFIEHPHRIIGSGANLLVRDKGYDGVIIKMATNEIIDNQCFIYADAGVKLSALINHATKKGLSGLEWASGIPGTVGGAIFMNAGAYGGCMADIAVMVDVLIDGEIVTLESNQCKFDYRKSIFQRKRKWIILGAYFFLENGDPDTISAKYREIIAKRKIAQPQQPSAGSVFRRPPNSILSVGEMVEQLGLKGLNIGGAQISEKHGGFIINKGGATSTDVMKLIRIIKNRVYEAYGIRLAPEIELI